MMERAKAKTPSQPYKKVTVCLYDRQIMFLDKATLAIRMQTGKPMRRAELIRALIDKAAGID